MLHGGAPAEGRDRRGCGVHLADLARTEGGENARAGLGHPGVAPAKPKQRGGREDQW